MIIVQLNGGLGNQLFQYAHGRKLSHERGVPLFLDDRLLGGETKGSNWMPREYALHHYPLAAHIASREQIDELLYRATQSGWKGLLKRWIRPAILIKEDDDEKTIPMSGDIYLSGYWQSEIYFSNIRNMILNEFTPKTLLNEKSQQVYNKIAKCNSVAVHFRRGDYIKDPATNAVHGICPTSYYTSAMQLMREMVSETHFFIFSDDIETVKRENFVLHDVSFVDTYPNKKDFEDLTLMSACKHHIIANSSFSWWGAWLSCSSKKIVVAPTNWFRDKEKNKLAESIVPSNWIKI